MEPKIQRVMGGLDRSLAQLGQTLRHTDTLVVNTSEDVQSSVRALRLAVERLDKVLQRIDTLVQHKEVEIDETLTNLHQASAAVKEISEYPWKLMTGQGKKDTHKIRYSLIFKNIDEYPISVFSSSRGNPVNAASRGMSMTVFPSPEEVRAIVAPANEAVLRNLRITQGYHDLSDGMLRITGGKGINWCTLGTWASKTAGGFIRGDEVPGAFRKLLLDKQPFSEVEKKIGGGLVGLAASIVHDISAYIMEGNRVVFQELAGCFSAFLTELGGDEAFDEARLRAFQEQYEEDPPEPDKVWFDKGQIKSKRMGGQVLLREMSESYYRAMFETDAKARAELLLLANARGGLHEQTRLQTYIAGSLNAPIQDTILGHAHDHVDEHVHESLRDEVHSFVDRFVPSVTKELEEAWHDFATIAMMTLTLPDGTIHLARPIPPDPGTPIVPPTLETIENPELRAILEKFDALDPPERESVLARAEDSFASLLGLGHNPSHVHLAVGAVDWVSLDQRMRFILALFRSRADDAHLFQQPFTGEQRTGISAGEIPKGPL